MLISLLIGGAVGYGVYRLFDEHGETIDKAYELTKKYMEDISEMFVSDDEEEKEEAPKAEPKRIAHHPRTRKGGKE